MCKYSPMNNSEHLTSEKRQVGKEEAPVMRRGLRMGNSEDREPEKTAKIGRNDQARVLKVNIYHYIESVERPEFLDSC